MATTHPLSAISRLMRRTQPVAAERPAEIDYYRAGTARASITVPEDEANFAASIVFRSC
jgi:hypothetical protein